MASPSAAHSRAVQEVLGASDHYTVLAATRELDEASLRRCYLKRSVAVHPDKNPHELATTAFQRVGEAWAVLSDADKRRAYDRDPEGFMHEGSGGPAGVGLSAEEAFAVFAAAVAAAASSGSFVGSFGETLYWGQRLVESRRNGADIDAAALVHGGFAVSSGIRTVGATADALGFKGLGDASRTAANLVQAAAGAAAVGAVASKIPAVQEKLDYSKQKLQDVGAAVGERAKQVNETLEGMNTKEKLETVMGGVSSWLKRARATLDQSKHEAEEDIPEKRSK